MLFSLIILFLAYTFFKVCVSILQINFLIKEREKNAVVLSEDEYKKAADIAIQNQKFDIFTTAFSSFISILWIAFGLKVLFLNIVKNDTTIEHLTFIMTFLVINFLLELPIGAYEKFVKDKRNGFSNITPKVFITDTIKSLALTLIFGGAFIWLMLICINFLGSMWWFWAFLLSFCIIILINLIYPTIIAPMFNKVTPLENGELKSSIETLLTNLGFKSSGVFVMDASKRDNRLNAYFGGLGATKRVVLFDTLINKLNINEIIAVLGHELGHFKNKDILKMIAISSVMLFCLFAIFGNIPNEIYKELGISGGGAIILFLMIFSPLFSFVFNPIIAYISRKNEFNADKFGAKTKDTQSMIEALIKLGSENKAFPKYHLIYSVLYNSHPSLYERIEKLKYENR